MARTITIRRVPPTVAPAMMPAFSFLDGDDGGEAWATCGSDSTVTASSDDESRVDASAAVAKLV